MSLPLPLLLSGLTTLLLITLRILIAILTLVLTIIVYRLTLHPLSAVPGPKLAAVSNIWHAYHARNGRMVELGRTLHRQYGPVVRVGPDEVWFDTKEAFQAIYSE